MQYNRATLTKLRIVLYSARTKLTAAQKRNSVEFDNNVGFCLVVEVGDYVYVD